MDGMLCFIKIHISLITCEAGILKTHRGTCTITPMNTFVIPLAETDWLLSKLISFSSWSFPALQQMTVAGGISSGQGDVGLSDVQPWPAWLLEATCEILLFPFFPQLLAKCWHQSGQWSQMMKVTELLSAWCLNYLRKQSQASPCFHLEFTWARDISRVLGHWNWGVHLLTVASVITNNTVVFVPFFKSGSIRDYSLMRKISPLSMIWVGNICWTLSFEF